MAGRALAWPLQMTTKHRSLGGKLQRPLGWRGPSTAPWTGGAALGSAPGWAPAAPAGRGTERPRAWAPTRPWQSLGLCPAVSGSRVQNNVLRCPVRALPFSCPFPAFEASALRVTLGRPGAPALSPVTFTNRVPEGEAPRDRKRDGDLCAIEKKKTSLMLRTGMGGGGGEDGGRNVLKCFTRGVRVRPRAARGAGGRTPACQAGRPDI